MQQDLSTVFDRAVKFIFTHRDPDGLWTYPDDKFLLPSHYQTPLVKSFNACRALLTVVDRLTAKELSILQESLHRLLYEELPADSPVDNYAFKLLLSAYSNTGQTQALRDVLTDEIYTRRKNGIWESYSNTYHYTNFFILSALMQNNLPAPMDYVKWARTRASTKGHGWGFAKNEAPQASPTATILLSCLMAGLSADDVYVQKVVHWLEKTQNADGGWPASKVTEKKLSTFHSTAHVLVCLLLTCESNRPSIQKAVKFLLSGQQKDGSWPHTTGDEIVYFFTMHYVLFSLVFYDTLTRVTTPQYSQLKKGLSQSKYAFFIFSECLHKSQELFVQRSTNVLLYLRALGTSHDSQERRQIILQLLSKKTLDEAGIIDELKLRKQYATLSKRAHLTLIKKDVLFLQELGLLHQRRHKWFIVNTP